MSVFGSFLRVSLQECFIASLYVGKLVLSAAISDLKFCNQIASIMLAMYIITILNISPKISRTVRGDSDYSIVAYAESVP